jgi:hypothetical protein
MIHLLVVTEARAETYNEEAREAKTEFKIGRGQKSEVRINDISVSRCHAVIRYRENDGFYIEDNQSKFGTIVLLKDKYPLAVNLTLAVQVGRTVVSLTARSMESQIASVSTASNSGVPILQNNQVVYV